MSLITLLSRVLGLIREMVRAALLGTTFLSDAYILAFSLPNLFRRLSAEGAMVNAFIPVFASSLKDEGEERALDFASRFFAVLTIGLTVFSALFILAAPWLVEYIFAVGYSGEPLSLTVSLTRFMFSYIVFISLAALFQGVLNSFRVFWVSAFTPVLLNVFIIGCGWGLSSFLENPTYGFATGILLGGFVQAAFQVPFVRRRGFRFWRALRGGNLFDERVKEVGKLMLPGMFGVGIYQINIVISHMIATTLGEGALSSLSFSNRLLELVLGVFVISIATVILPDLSSLFHEGKKAEAATRLEFALRIVSFITLPVIFGVLVIREELVAVLFQRGEFDSTSLRLTVSALTMHIPGLFFIGWNRVILAAFYAAKDFKTPVKIAFWVMATNLVAALALSRYFGFGPAGIALGSTVSQAFQTAMLLFFAPRILERTPLSGKVVGGFILVALNSVLVFVVLYLVREVLGNWGWNLYVSCFSLIFLGIFLFVVGAFVFRIGEFREFLAVARRKK